MESISHINRSNGQEYQCFACHELRTPTQEGKCPTCGMNIIPQRESLGGGPDIDKCFR